MKIEVDSLRGMRCAPPTSEQWCGALALLAGLLGLDFWVVALPSFGLTPWASIWVVLTMEEPETHEFQCQKRSNFR